METYPFEADPAIQAIEKGELQTSLNITVSIQHHLVKMMHENEALKKQNKLKAEEIDIQRKFFDERQKTLELIIMNQQSIIDMLKPK
jgi:hypothetical protein